MSRGNHRLDEALCEIDRDQQVTPAPAGRTDRRRCSGSTRLDLREADRACRPLSAQPGYRTALKRSSSLAWDESSSYALSRGLSLLFDDEEEETEHPICRS